MLFNIAILFFCSLLAGLSILFLPDIDLKKFKRVLSFSGAYLFSVTVIHLLPEIFHESKDIRLVGIFVLIGFFIQMILEYFTSGVEHGHIHVHEGHGNHIPYSMFISLCIHAFLEGTLLVHPSHQHGHDDVHTLLYGLVLHKIPEAIALMSVLVLSFKNRYLALVLLLIFSAASPLGMVISSIFYIEHLVPEHVFLFLFAVVAGNFLYISTTIFFETSPNHKFKANKLLFSLLGAVLAIMAEYFL